MAASSQSPSSSRRLKLLTAACIALAAAFVLCLGAAAFALGESSVSARQNLSTGTVDVETLTASDGVVTGENLAVSTTSFAATNAGTLPFYVRAKISTGWYDASGNPAAGTDPSLIIPNVVAQGAWVDGGDGYWYWQDMVDPGQNTDKLVSGSSVSVEADYTYSDLVARVSVSFEAVQATHQAADALWGQGDLYADVQQTATEADLGSQMYATITDEGVSLADEGVLDAGELVPGGTMTFDIQVRNDTASDRIVALSLQADDSLDEAQRALLDDYLSVSVANSEGTVLWSGGYSELANGLKDVGAITSRGLGTLVVTVSLSGDAPNGLQGLGTTLTWTVSTRDASDNGNSGDDNGGGAGAGGGGGGTGIGTGQSAGSAQHTPQTGDAMRVIVPATLAALSGIFLIIALIARHREREREM